jgi:hypothetical protein
VIRELDDFEKRLIENVRAHGCQINHVFEPDDESSGFSYSIGFWETVNQPEVIVFGLPQDVQHFMINETLRKCRDGFELGDGVLVDDLLEGHSVIARSVHPSRMVPEYFNSAIWYRRHRGAEGLPSAVQLVWPGAGDRLFPWDDNCSEIVRDLQPPLYLAELNA